jgi:AraC-like DNA-binding protein
MSLQLVNSNHTSESETSELEAAEAAVARLAEALAAVGCPDCLVIRPHDYERLLRDQTELLALKRALLLGGTDSKPPQLWKVPQMAKELGLSESAVRRRARTWSFTRCIAHGNCRGGRRGCDLRFVAKDAAAWVNRQRAGR